MEINNRKNSALIVFGVGIVFTFILIYSVVLSGEDQYVQDIIKFRKEKDNRFKNAADSPLPDSVKKNFKNLNYYDVDKLYNITASFTQDKLMNRVEVPQNDPTKKEYLTIAGKLKFWLNKNEYTLTAFLQNERNTKVLFIPFKDLTSGKTTYGGGRYLEDVRLINGKAILDFNKAFNPLCVFNYSFICPVPPPENTLPVEILAGEKNY